MKNNRVKRMKRLSVNANGKTIVQHETKIRRID